MSVEFQNVVKRYGTEAHLLPPLFGRGKFTVLGGVVTYDTLAIVLVSLAIGQPFTLQYARERVPEQFWALPVFFTTNVVITTIWAGAFAVLVAADAAAEWLPAVPLWVDIVASIVAFVGAVWFSNWYPAVVQRRSLAAAQ